MTPFAKHIMESRRLALLRLLKDSQGSANESVIHTGLDLLGFGKTSRETIREDIRFLDSNGLIKTTWFTDVQVCAITKRGVEVAGGVIEIDGVQSPSIGL